MQKRTLGLLLAATVVVSAAAQTPARIDFRRDVQPIFREQCYGCHGQDQQMNGFRLDRRGAAMRGGTQSVIGPGNADGSRLYHRLIGTQFGTRMPPAGPLHADQIAIIKAWIDQGAAWPDDVSGERPSLPVDRDTERLALQIRDGDDAAVDRSLRDSPGLVRLRGEGGTTPLMMAALYGDAGLVKRLLDAGADPNAANSSGATALMWAVPNFDNMRLLLDAGANVNARSEENRSALVIASGIQKAAPAARL